MKHSLLRHLYSTGLCIALTAPVLYAQSPDDTDVLESSTVLADEAPAKTFTGLKTETPLIDVPQSVSVITADELDAQGLDSIADIIDYTPGVVNSQGEGHRDSVVFRGNRTTADFFVDGVRDDVQYFRSLYNVKQVEVLRGPNALTFGRGGVGGVLNRVLKKAEIGEEFGEFQGRVNTFGGFYSQFDYNSGLGDTSAFRLNAFIESLENHRDFFDGERFGVNPTFTWDLTPDTTLILGYEYNDHERFIDRGIPSGPDGRPARQLSGTTFGDSQLNETTLESHTFDITLKHRFSDQWNGKLKGFYGSYDKVYQNYFPNSFRRADDSTPFNSFDPSTGLIGIDGYVDTTDRQTFSLSGDLIGEFSTGGIDHKVLIGGEFITTDSDQDRLNNVFTAAQGQTLVGTSPGSGTPFDIAAFPAAGLSISNGVVRGADGTILATGTLTDLNDDTRVTVDAVSFFLQDEIAINDQLDVILGARFDSFDIDVKNVRSGTRLGNTDQEVSPRLGLVYKPVDNLSFYASYSETFLPRSGEQFTDIDSASDRFDADTFSNLEAGLKWDIQDDLSLSFAAFQIEQSSAQTDNSGNNTLTVVDTDTVGFEAQLKGNITDNWYVSAGYSYLDGEIAGSSNTPREQPQNTVSLWNSFTVTDKFGFGLGLIYQDESFTSSSNAVTLPSYVRVDASAYYRASDSLRFQVNVENLLDRDYFPSAHTDNNITVGAPLNATFSVVKTF